MLISITVLYTVLEYKNKIGELKFCRMCAVVIVAHWMAEKAYTYESDLAIKGYGYGMMSMRINFVSFSFANTRLHSFLMYTVHTPFALCRQIRNDKVNLYTFFTRWAPNLNKLHQLFYVFIIVPMHLYFLYSIHIVKSARVFLFIFIYFRPNMQGKNVKTFPPKIISMNLFDSNCLFLVNRYYCFKSNVFSTLHISCIAKHYIFSSFVLIRLLLPFL